MSDIKAVRNLHQSLLELLGRVMHLDGCVVEAGVYKGRSLKKIMEFVGDRKTVYGMDTFSGFPDGLVGAHDWTHMRSPSEQREMFIPFERPKTVLEQLQAYATKHDVDLRILKGVFEENAALVQGNICFVHVDFDLYESTKQVFNAFYDRLVPGGIMAIDDYKTLSKDMWPGTRKATDEFFADKPEVVETNGLYWYATKQQ